MASPVIICRVKALYDFQSTDPSSLTFKKDDEIDVLAQLESGWWDGWCNGERGWFPCNYVQVVEISESENEEEEEEEDEEEEEEDGEEEEEEEEEEEQGEGTLAQRIAAEVKDPWIPQTTPDGIIFYLNTETGESSWTFPMDQKEMLELQAQGEHDEAARRAASATPNALSDSSSVRTSLLSSDRATTPRADSPGQQRARAIHNSKKSAGANDHKKANSSTTLGPGVELPADWVLQQTEDGMSSYYFNTVTEEMRWKHPLDTSENGEGFRENGSIDDEELTEDGDEEEEEEEEEEEGGEEEENVQHNEDAAAESETEDAVTSERRRSSQVQAQDDVKTDDETKRQSVASSGGSRLSGGEPRAPQIAQEPQEEEEEEEDEKLPPNWVKKFTTQGRPYYCNLQTQETTWTLENVNMETGNMLPKVDRSSTSSSNSGLSHNELGEPALEASLANVAPQPLPRSPSRMTNGYRRKNLLDPNEPLTWSKLAANIALSIHNLNTSAKVVQRNLFVPHASAIVESIRHMLYASGTIEKESPLIKANKTLKVHHRAIMASLSKLVLSAKLASGVWPPPDAIAKMQSDANEVLVAVRDFVNTAQAIGIEVRHVDPRLVPGVQNWRQRNGVGNSGRRSSASNGAKDGQSSRYSLQQDLHNNLELYARNMAKSLTLLITHAKNAAERPTQGFRSSANNPLNAATPLLIAQFRNLSTQISQFINIVEDIYIDDTLPSVGEFRLSKQSLYNAVGYLFNATQNVTDPNTPESVSKAVDSATRKVEESLWDVCDSVKGMILERQEKLKAPAPAPVGPAPVPEGHVNGDGPYVRRGSNPESSNGHSLNHNKQRSRSISGFSSGIGSRDGGASTVDTLPEEEEEADAPHFPDIVSNDGTASRSQHIYSDEDEAYDDVMADESTEDGGIMSPPVRKYRSSRREPRNNNDDDENISSDSDVSQRSSMHEGAIASIPPHLRKRSESNANSVSSEPTSASGFPAGPQRSMTGPPGDFLITGAGQKSPRGDKLKKFFGVDHVQDGGPVRTPARDEKPWYLGYDYPPSEMVLNMEGYVKGGTLTALVERLTLHDYLDSNFINTFLLTYRSFCTTKEFFDLLVKRFTMEPPQGLTSEELENWEEKKRKPVRLRVSNIIKNWVENYYNEDEDSEVLENIREFASTTMQEKLPITAMPLIKLIDKRTMKKLVPNSIAAAPAPMLPKNMKRFRFLDVDPLELARQLTIMDSRLYTKIKPVECLDKAWSCEDSENEAVNVKACIEYHNQVTAWVSDSILSQGEVKKRTAIIKHWVQVAEKCRILNNFNTCMAILASFDSSAIGRLKRTWETVTQRTMQTLAYIRKLMGTNKNFNEYREIIKKINPPCIPFLGIYLQDLTFIEDGNTGFLKKSKTLINFSKRMKTAEVIRDIQVYQSTPYLLHPIPEIQVFIKTHLTSSRDDVTLYELSLQLEPREREDEKIARLLAESGFL